ncbi:MAG: phosphoenolpyruvate synthase, partial [Minisyncoccales bacterium]
FSLKDEEIQTLAKWATTIEKHYNRPQDIEWAKDGETGELFIVQSRPETVHAPGEKSTYEEYSVNTDKEPLVTGIAVGNKIGTGKAKVIRDVKNIDRFEEGDVLVTEMTDPDWVPIMRKAAAIITNEGGKSCHAAIVARELGIPTIVGTENGTKKLRDGQMITVDCTQGLDGKVFEGKVDFDVKEYELEKIPELDTKIMVNIGAPEIAFSSSFLPQEGVGLAREEFIIAEKIRVHPLALYYYEELKKGDKKLLEKLDISKGKAEEIVEKIKKNTVEHDDKKEFFAKELAEGVSQIAAGFYPKEVIVRFSDFKTNEYKNLIGGELFEDEESNPMLGFRGASRYLDDEFKHAFKMECKAIKRAREKFGLKNISVMVPFCRTVKEGKEVRKLIEKFGLDSDNLNVYVMCEIPSNVIIAEQFLEIFDGMSIGTNDLTQLTLGLDRDNAKIAGVGDERDDAVKKMVAKVIRMCKEKDKYVGICGEAPSTYINFAKFLMEEGIDSMSLNPNVVIKTIMQLAEIKKED